MRGYVYILRDNKGKLYIGSTIDLNRRLTQHQVGHTKTTHRMIEPKLVFKQLFSTIAEARRTERKLKAWKRKDYIEKIIEDGYIRITLARP
ncbi:MAG: GIY-YIG nuclease family protein [Candidatus Kerfeldbacteria bacterium]|nr:GIY-YIG nuclease family protein [Candidatus Kerfeldbacteria bacterium]